MSLHQFPPPIIVEPSVVHRRTIIFLHGRGDDASDFSHDLLESEDSQGKSLTGLLSDCKWVFPSANLIYSKVFQEDLRQWYDIMSLTSPDDDSEVQLHGMRESVRYIREVVAHERSVLSGGKLILAGISQGFTISLLSCLIDPSQIDALIGFASWLPLASQVKNIIAMNIQDDEEARRSVSMNICKVLDVAESGSPSSIPIFLAHCVNDEAVDIALGRDMKEVLVRFGHSVTWVETEDGGHWIKEPEAIDKLNEFLIHSAQHVL